MLLCVIVGPLFRVVAKFGGLIDGELEVESRAAVEECAANLIGADIVRVEVGEVLLEKLRIAHEAALQLAEEFPARVEFLGTVGGVAVLVTHEDEHHVNPALEPTSRGKEGTLGADIGGAEEVCRGLVLFQHALNVIDAGACGVDEGLVLCEAVGFAKPVHIGKEIEHKREESFHGADIAKIRESRAVKVGLFIFHAFFHLPRLARLRVEFGEGGECIGGEDGGGLGHRRAPYKEWLNGY